MSPFRPRSRVVVTITLLGLALQAAPARGAAGAPPEPPPDYTETAGLSQPAYETARESETITMSDGVEIYVEVVRPTSEGRFPVILELSPYHGVTADRNGSTMVPYPRIDGEPIGLTGYFPPRGYAVVMADLRGTGRSQGCLDHLGPRDAEDAKAIVEWAASQPWSSGRVGMTGHSYVGSTPIMAAAQQPEGLVTIVPSAGLASMYDHQFQAGVPYALQYAGPMVGYAWFSTLRHLPPNIQEPVLGGWTGDNWMNDPQYTGCGWASTSLTSGEAQLSGRYAPWHAARDWRPEATAANIPVFLVHGVPDDAVRIAGADWFFDRDHLANGDKAWLGWWGHRLPRELQWTYALHAWFDHHLQQRTWVDESGNVREIETGPPIEVFSNENEQDPGTSTHVYTADRIDRGPATRVLHASADGSLGAEPDPGIGEGTFTGDPHEGYPLMVDDDGRGPTGNVTFTSGPATDDLMILGRTKLRLGASVSVARIHLIATLYDESPSGYRRRVTTCAMNPELRDGIDTLAPVIPLLRMDLEPPCLAAAHHLREGHRLVLRVTTSHPDKVPTFAVDPQVTVFTGPGGTSITMPVVEDPVVHPDPTAATAEG